MGFKKPKKDIELEREAGRNTFFPAFRINKHYDEMNRTERREYERWLNKNGLWDGAVVAKNVKGDSRNSKWGES